MVRARLVVLLSGFLLLAAGFLIIGVAVATHRRLGPLALTAAQLGVAAFYWFPWSTARRFRPPRIARVFAVIALVVSLVIIGVSVATFLFTAGLFLIVHAAANIALARRPQVYLCWILGVWVVGPMAIAVLLGLFSASGFLHMARQELLTAFVKPSSGITSGIEWSFWVLSLVSFVGTAAGLGLALAWRWRRLKKEGPTGADVRETDKPHP